MKIPQSSTLDQPETNWGIDVTDERVKNAREQNVFITLFFLTLLSAGFAICVIIAMFIQSEVPLVLISSSLSLLVISYFALRWSSLRLFRSVDEFQATKRDILERCHDWETEHLKPYLLERHGMELKAVYREESKALVVLDGEEFVISLPGVRYRVIDKFSYRKLPGDTSSLYYSVEVDDSVSVENLN